ncbi:MAG TPA: SDR family oxidoreductase [Bryobacteraceae bacterium]|jgi:short-subunit dehydrogenase|nr:SDR family oxidoreductase [Bryobacteraceae bacterium]
MSKTALITGASSGIGYELAKCFARDGASLVLVARDETRLGQVAAELRSPSVSVRVVPADLARAVAPSEILDATRAANINVDYLVNNAGFGFCGFFAESDLRGDLDMLQVNMVALMHLTRLYLPGMLQRGSGGILNVASTAAFQPGPLMALYYATKAFVLSLTEAIAEELRDTAVTATALCPGPTATDFQRRAKIEGIRLMKSKFAMMTAREVAEIGYRGFLEGKVIVIPGLLNKIGAQSVRISPRAMVRKVTRKLQES